MIMITIFGLFSCKVMFEEINWHAKDGFKTKIDAFVDEVIHPHILAEVRLTFNYRASIYNTETV